MQSGRSMCLVSKQSVPDKGEGGGLIRSEIISEIYVWMHWVSVCERIGRVWLYDLLVFSQRK